jgi:hypothetical protein
LALLAGVAVLIAAGVVWYVRSRKTPEERERLRRLGVNARGRITDGFLVEMMDREGRQILVYEYSVAQVSYHSAQDISQLAAPEEIERVCEGLPARVKYDPLNPGDSIIVCEDWSGL